MSRQIETVAQFIARRGFTEPQVRWWIFQAKTNGLSAAGALVRIGRRIFIDNDGFDRWLDALTDRESV